ncbi:MAG TPA: C45 family peptidase [Kofleriaceae bacterium]|nr:C45 family peptidase [Kofleriaceae bacterium]
MRILELPAGASPRAWGRQHGELFRAEIHALSAIRTYLSTKLGAFRDRAQVLAAAHAHLPVLERYDHGLFEELVGIAEGAALTPAEIVVTNHYTDLRDLDPEPSRWRPAPASDEGCSAVWAASPTGRILAQTWDMHATAIPFVMMLHVPESEAGPAAWFLTLTGCLGLAGMNAARVAITINNLNSKDATVGAVWPAVVRRALHARTAAAARDVVLRSPIGSGHHYLIADRDDAFAIETSGVLRKVMFSSTRGHQAGSYCHTNHCLDPDVAAVSAISPTSTTRERMAWLEASLGAAPVRDLEDVWQRLGSTEGWPKSICTNTSTPENPHGTATCGAIAMNLDTGDVWAQTGFVNHVRPVELTI